MTYTQHRDTQEVLQTLDKLDMDMDEERLNNEEEIYKKFGWEDDFYKQSLSPWQKLKPKIWFLFDEPRSSTAAKVSHFSFKCYPKMLNYRRSMNRFDRANRNSRKCLTKLFICVESIHIFTRIMQK